jgi:hypothetical protein
MPSLTLGIATVTFEDHYPTIDGEVAFTVPADVPDAGGKTYTLPAFSLSAQNPSTSIAVNVPQFGGSITVSLDIPHTSVAVQGSINMTTPNPATWPVGPGSAPYFTPPPPRRWTTEASIPAITQTMLQDALNSSPAGNRFQAPTFHVDTSKATKLALDALLVFYGMYWLKKLMKENLDACAASLTQSLRRAKPSGAAATAGPADSRAGGVVLALGPLDTVGVVVGGSAGYGMLITTDGDFGVYGTVAINSGELAAISTVLAFSVYWGIGGASGLQCFKGRNTVVCADVDVGASVGIAVAWPYPANMQDQNPCGVTLSAGIGLGAPFDLFISNSDTWSTAQVPPPITGNVIFQGDTSYWNAGLQLYWFSTWAEAMQIDPSSGAPAWSNGTGAIQNANINWNDPTLSGMPSGVLAVSGLGSEGLQLFMITNYNDNVYLQLGADGQQPASYIYQQSPPSGFQATNPPGISAGPGLLTTTLQCNFYSTWEDAFTNQNSIATGTLEGGTSMTDIPGGWNWLVIQEATAGTTLLVIPFLGGTNGMTGMVDMVNGQPVFYVTS